MAPSLGLQLLHPSGWKQAVSSLSCPAPRPRASPSVLQKGGVDADLARTRHTPNYHFLIFCKKRKRSLVSQLKKELVAGSQESTQAEAALPSRPLRPPPAGRQLCYCNPATRSLKSWLIPCSLANPGGLRLAVGFVSGFLRIEPRIEGKPKLPAGAEGAEEAPLGW